jgi:hypothetical protein
MFPELAESEDERIRKALKEYFINSFQNNGVAAICGVHIKDILTWLEKKDEQEPAWSEENKCMLNNVIDTLKPLSQTTHSGYAINSMIDWLKSLKPQNTWKPSEYELKVLKLAAEKDGACLMGLYQQLKKLRGE